MERFRLRLLEKVNIEAQISFQDHDAGTRLPWVFQQVEEVMGTTTSL